MIIITIKRGDVEIRQEGLMFAGTQSGFLISVILLGLRQDTGLQQRLEVCPCVT